MIFHRFKAAWTDSRTGIQPGTDGEISRGADKHEQYISSHRTAVSAENSPFADKVFPLGYKQPSV